MYVCMCLCMYACMLVPRFPVNWLRVIRFREFYLSQSGWLAACKIFLPRGLVFGVRILRSGSGRVVEGSVGG